MCITFKVSAISAMILWRTAGEAPILYGCGSDRSPPPLLVPPKPAQSILKSSPLKIALDKGPIDFLKALFEVEVLVCINSAPPPNARVFSFLVGGSFGSLCRSSAFRMLQNLIPSPSVCVWIFHQVDQISWDTLFYCNTIWVKFNCPEERKP